MTRGCRLVTNAFGGRILGIESEGLRLRLTIGISGRVKYVGAATPPSPKLRPLLPCIRGDVARWTFPPNEEEYAVDINVSPPRWR